ncbi:MAG: cyclase family protein [Actinomycetota bacterium]|nr:cyclase family protein [Actinomycetota bacterium]
MCLSHTAEIVRQRAAGLEMPRLDRRSFLKGGAGLALGATLWPSAALADTEVAGSPLPVRRLQDLTHTFRVDFPVFTDGEEPTRRTVVTIEDDGYYLQEWTFYEHTATHLDAPGHFVPGGRLAPQIDPRELLVPAVVVDISDKARANPDAQVTVADLRTFERRHGAIPRRALVCMYSGWEVRADDEQAYRGTDESGVYHFPGFSVEAVEWLLERRRITGIGVDTLSLDYGLSQTFQVHVTLLGADKYGLENLANLAHIPPRGSWAFVGLVPWEEGSGGPCRVIAGW